MRLNTGQISFCFINLFLAILMYGCNSGDKVIHEYESFIDQISSSEFPLSKLISNPKTANSGFTEISLKNHDLILIPATFWQLYSLTGNEKWKVAASKFSNFFRSENHNRLNLSGEEVRICLITQYQITHDPDMLSLFKEYYFQNCSQIEDFEKATGCDDTINSVSVKKLLDIKALFFATEITGDPVYKDLAIRNSEMIYEKCFCDTNSAAISSKLALDSLSSDQLNILDVSDLDFMAHSFYGFNEVYQNTGIETYNRLSQNIAQSFCQIFQNPEKYKDLIASMDLMSQALVCLALFEMDDKNTDDFKQTAKIINKNILHRLKQFRDTGEVGASFRLFFYLFEYERKRNEN